MAEMFEGQGMGWLPDYPDFRDHTKTHVEAPTRRKLAGDKQPIKDMLGELGVRDQSSRDISEPTNLREWCSPIEDQGSISSCTAHAGVGIVEYFERRVFGRYLDASRLFLYKVTRNLMQRTGDTGSFLRTTMHAMVLFGTLVELPKDARKSSGDALSTR